jgi:hypothetical protein
MNRQLKDTYHNVIINMLIEVITLVVQMLCFFYDQHGTAWGVKKGRKRQQAICPVGGPLLKQP